MKKTLTIIILSIVVAFTLYSTPSEYYPVSSDEWKLTNDICRLAGVSGPSSFGPVTGNQLLIALDRAKDDSSLSDLINKAIDMICSFDSLYSDDLGAIALESEFNEEIYLQTNGDELDRPPFGYDDDWFVRNNRERPAFLSIKLENVIGPYFYSRFVFPMREKQIIKDFYWDDAVHFLGESKKMEQNYPFDAGIAFSTNNLSLITGRGKVSQGEGFTGNTAVGDNYDYQEFLKLGANTRNTGVFLTITSFDSSRTSFDDSRVKITEPYKVQNASFSGYRELRHSVGYEMTLFDRMKFSLSFINLIDTNTAFDFRYLNPFMIMHNYFNYHEDTILEANNMISADLSIAMTKGFRLYLQFTMDQIQLAGETKSYNRKYLYVDPNAFAGLINLSWSKEIKSGMFTLWGEAVYTSPAMYLNQKYYDENGNVTQYKGKLNGSGTEYISSYEACWSQDFLLGYNRTESNNYDADMAFAGYIYGPDAIVASIGGEYYIPQKIDVTARVFYMAHGEKGRGTDKNNYNFSGIDSKETINTLSPTGIVEHTLALSAECDWTLSDFVSLYGGAAYSYRWNYRNEEGRNVGNLQTAFGVKLSYTL